MGVETGEKQRKTTPQFPRRLGQPRISVLAASTEPAIMAPFDLEVLKEHALAESSPRHYGHFRRTPQRYPAYSAGIVPYRWMR